MIYFESDQILFALLCSVIYGALYWALFMGARSCRIIASRLVERVKSVFVYAPPFYKVKRNSYKEIDFSFGAAFVFTSVILFFLGYVLLSYYALDGETRIYTLATSVLVFLLLNRYASPLLLPLVFTFFDLLLLPSVVLLRAIFLPMRRVLSFVISKKVKKDKNGDVSILTSGA